MNASLTIRCRSLELKDRLRKKKLFSLTQSLTRSCFDHFVLNHHSYVKKEGSQGVHWKSWSPRSVVGSILREPRCWINYYSLVTFYLMWAVLVRTGSLVGGLDYFCSPDKKTLSPPSARIKQQETVDPARSFTHSSSSDQDENVIVVASLLSRFITR